MKSIFPRSCPAIENVFHDAGSPRKVILLPLDYAKRSHTALACDGEGRQLRAPFDIQNDLAGVDFLLDVVSGLRRRHHIRPQHVIYGGEDCGSFCFNFIHALASRQNLVIGLNAQDADLERGKLPASTDKLDLTGIAALLMKRQGRVIGTDYSAAAILRRLTHHRNSVVGAHSGSARRIHHLVDQLLPGFLDEKKSGLSPFTRASLWIMSDRFSPAGVHSRQRPALIAKFQEFNVRYPETAATKLKALAERVLPPPPALASTLQTALQHEVGIYSGLEETLQRLLQSLAVELAPTPGALLTTLPGIAIPLAAGLFAELGDPARRRALRRLTSYGGLAPRLKQTGGPEKEARTRGVSRRANYTLRTLLFLLAHQIDQHGHPELKADYNRRRDAGQRVQFTMARRMLRIVLHVLDHRDFFVPPSLVHSPAPDALRQHYVSSWRPLLYKWRNAGAIRQAFTPGNPLEDWRTLINETYQLNLSNLSPQAADEPED